jgi:hypothetical protein
MLQKAFLMIIYFLQYLTGQLSQRRIHSFTTSWTKSNSEFRKQKKVILGSQLITSNYFVEVIQLMPDSQIFICSNFLRQRSFRKKPPWLIIKNLYTILVTIQCHNRLCHKIFTFKSKHPFSLAYMMQVLVCSHDQYSGHTNQIPNYVSHPRDQCTQHTHVIMDYISPDDASMLQPESYE